MTVQDIHYPAEFTNRLEILWGDGFLSPGGPEEVKEILKGIAWMVNRFWILDAVLAGWKSFW